MSYFFIPIYKTISDITVKINNPIGENAFPTMPKNFGTAPINKANVNNPNAIPLLLSNILLRAVSVIGIVILKNNIAKIPIVDISKPNINNKAASDSDITDIFLNPILSPIIPPSIFPNITEKIDNTAKIIFDFHSKANINPT